MREQSFHRFPLSTHTPLIRLLRVHSSCRLPATVLQPVSRQQFASRKSGHATDGYFRLSLSHPFSLFFYPKFNYPSLALAPAAAPACHPCNCHHCSCVSGAESGRGCATVVFSLPLMRVCVRMQSIGFHEEDSVSILRECHAEDERREREEEPFALCLSFSFAFLFCVPLGALTALSAAAAALRHSHSRVERERERVQLR